MSCGIIGRYCGQADEDPTAHAKLVELRLCALALALG
jgi:hypothetical protein